MDRTVICHGRTLDGTRQTSGSDDPRPDAIGHSFDGRWAMVEAVAELVEGAKISPTSGGRRSESLHGSLSGGRPRHRPGWPGRYPASASGSAPGAPLRLAGKGRAPGIREPWLPNVGFCAPAQGARLRGSPGRRRPRTRAPARPRHPDPDRGSPRGFRPSVRSPRHPGRLGPRGPQRDPSTGSVARRRVCRQPCAEPPIRDEGDSVGNAAAAWQEPYGPTSASGRGAPGERGPFASWVTGDDVTVTGIFDHRAARDCVWSSWITGDGEPAAVECRTKFVVTRVE